MDGVSSESENERLPNRALDCKTRGAYALGFGLIPPRLGLWARPLDGFDFSISTERGLSLFEVVLHHLIGWKKLDNQLILPHVMVQIFDDYTVDSRSAFMIFKGVKKKLNHSTKNTSFEYLFENTFVEFLIVMACLKQLCPFGCYMLSKKKK